MLQIPKEKKKNLTNAFSQYEFYTVGCANSEIPTLRPENHSLMNQRTNTKQPWIWILCKFVFVAFTFADDSKAGM